MADKELYRGHLVPDILVHALNYGPDRPLLVLDDGAALTAGQMRDLVSQYVGVFKALDLPPGTRVGVLSKNRPEVLHVTNALLLADMCLVPLHPMGSVDDLAYIAEDSEMECLIFDPHHFEDKATALQKRCPRLKHCLSLGESVSGTDLCQLAAVIPPAQLMSPQVEPEDVPRLAYSGGTTGAPKGIMISHQSMAAALTIQLMEWEWPSEVRALICAPLSHSGSAMFMPVIMRNGTLIVLEAFEPLAVLEAIEKHRITCMLLVPTMIYALLDHPRINDFDLSSLETIFYGASLISPARLTQAIEQFGPIFFQFYGQSEAPMTVTVMRRAEHRTDDPLRLASCGRPVPWVRVALLDDQGVEVPDGTAGEICVQGPLVMAGYYGRTDQTAEALAGDWLHTGDVAVRDPDGFLRIVDRKKDMIITGGFNVYPREVEDVLTSHPAVKDAAVVGLADEKWGEAVRAMVVLRPDAEVSAAELIALVRDRKGPVQAPKAINFVSAIPLSGLGKPDKKAVRTALAAGQEKSHV